MRMKGKKTKVKNNKDEETTGEGSRTEGECEEKVSSSCLVLPSGG